ncbi:uncharacterized protein [Macrobrachium rosenbergii]|uniref:uncharacterized protein n=1 Tax=Macrobrachium rosenbergii TaxID=79674 RepID=UPI0034D5428D
MRTGMLGIFLWIYCLLKIQVIFGRIRSERKYEFLTAAGEALDAILRTTVQPWCSMILVTDGSPSPIAIHKVLDHIEPLYGAQVYEMKSEQQPNNRTKDQLSEVIGEATRMLKSHKCVMTIVAATSTAFLETLLGLYAYDLQLVWKQRPILVTNAPLGILKGLISTHWELFATNAMVVHVQEARFEKRWIGFYSHQPFSPQNGGQVIRTASWTTLRGLVTAPKNKSETEKSDSVCCGVTLSVKEALKDPMTLNRILMSPGTFKFEKPVKVVITGEHWPTHIILNERNEVSGSMGSLLKALSQSLNFSYKIVRPEDGFWGSINDDGSWTGMVGMVHRHEADMALGPHDITLIRTTAIDYTSPIFTDARQFILAQNRAEVDSWGFMLPLTPTVWIGALIAFLVIGITTVAIARNYRGDTTPVFAMTVFFHTYRIFLNQGIAMKLQLVSERIVVLSWVVGAMIICWSYSTNLMSLLAVRYAPRPVQTIRDLIDDHHLIAIFPRRTALSDYVLSQESGILKEVADLRNVGRYMSLHYNDFPQALETLVRRGDHAIATCTTDAVNIIAKYFSEKGSCNFYIARETFVPFTLAMIVQKGSPLVEALSDRIRRIVGGGLYRYWLDSNLPNSTSCKHMPSSFTVKEPLAMTNIWGLFVLLASGLGIACLIFWVEVLFSKSCRSTCMTSIALLSWSAFMSLLWLQSVSAGEPPQMAEMETLLSATEGLKDLLQITSKRWCSIILVTDGEISPQAVKKVIYKMQPKFGIRLYEVKMHDQSLNETQQRLSNIIQEVIKWKKSHECVSVVASSNDAIFLDLFAGAYIFDLLLFWRLKPIVVTSLPLQQLRDLVRKHWFLFSSSSMVLRVPEDHEKQGRLIEIYTHLPYGPEEGGHDIRVATWSRQRGILASLKNEKRRLSIKEALMNPWTLSRLLFSPKTFRFKVPVQATIAAEEWTTHVTLKKLDENGDKYAFGGPMAKLTNAITQSLNVTYRIRQPPDGQWGSLNPNGTWTGLIGQVHRHEADFAVGPHDVTEVRSTAIDFTVNLVFDARKFIVAQNRAEVNPWGFVFPLTSMVWLCTFLSMWLVAVLTIAVGKSSQKQPLSMYAYAVVFHTYRLLLQQGLMMNIVRLPERLVVASWLIATMIICWSYSSNLMSLLAVKYAPRPIQTIRDLLDHKSMIVIFPRRTALSDYLFSVESGPLKEVADLSKIGRYMDLPYWEFPQALETFVSRGTHVMATDTIDAGSMIAGYFSKTGRCQFYIAREAFVPYSMAMVCQKGSPLVAAISKRIRAMFEAGLYQYWLNKNVPNSTACNYMPSTIAVLEPLSIANMWGLFVLLVSGLALSALTFCSEIFAGKWFSNS